MESWPMPWVERVKVDWSHWNFAAWLRKPLPDAILAGFDEDDREFAIRFLEDVLARKGDDHDVLASLGHLYTEANRYREGLAVDRRLVALRPRDPTAHYNLACSYSLLNRTKRAYLALKKAIRLGWRDRRHMEDDPDLENLRNAPWWDELLSGIKP